MYTRKNWVKHWDFIVFDLIMLELSFLIANFIRYRQGIRANIQMNRYIFYTEIVILIFCFFMTIVFDNPYKNILKNDASEEIVKQAFMIFVMNIVLLFVMHLGNVSSRIVIIIIYPTYIILSMIIRTLWKLHLRKKLSHYGSNKVMIVLSDSRHIKDIIDNLVTKTYKGYSIMGAFLLDYDGHIKKVEKVPVLGSMDDMIEYATHNWVDSATLAIQDKKSIEYLRDVFEVMGITTHVIVVEAPANDGEYIQKLGNYIVASNSYRSIPPACLFIKRVMDVLGGIVGYLFHIISFVDIDREGTIGKLEEVETFYPEYNCAIAACDDGAKRLEWNKKLETLYNTPVLFHMDSTISPSANLMPGCIVGCGSTIGQATVIGANTVVEPYSFIGDSCTLKSGTIVKSTSVLEMGTKTEQGTVLFATLEKK